MQWISLRLCPREVEKGGAVHGQRPFKRELPFDRNKLILLIYIEIMGEVPYGNIAISFLRKIDIVTSLEEMK